MGLAVGFILGGAVSKVVSALVADIINPFLGLALGAAQGLKTASINVGSAQILYGDLLSVIIDFIVVLLWLTAGSSWSVWTSLIKRKSKILMFRTNQLFF